MRAHVSHPASRLGMLALIALVVAAGCAGDTSSGPSTASINNIEVGMTESQVLSILGQPQKREAYGGTSFLFYTDTRGASVPVAIVGGRVTNIGRAAYDIVVRSQAQQQPTGSVQRK